jgi:hypothetical protein
MTPQATQNKEKSINKRFILMGDIIHPGKISVVAENLEDALTKAANGDFSIYDEQSKCLAFDWNGDKDSIEVE